MSSPNYLGIDYSVGATFIDGTGTFNGRWGAIHFTTNSHIDEITVQNYDGAPLPGNIFDASTTLYGVFTSIKLLNGHCVAYKI